MPKVQSRELFALEGEISAFLVHVAAAGPLALTQPRSDSARYYASGAAGRLYLSEREVKFSLIALTPLTWCYQCIPNVCDKGRMTTYVMSRDGGWGSWDCRSAIDDRRLRKTEVGSQRAEVGSQTSDLRPGVNKSSDSSHTGGEGSSGRLKPGHRADVTKVTIVTKFSLKNMMSHKICSVKIRRWRIADSESQVDGWPAFPVLRCSSLTRSK